MKLIEVNLTPVLLLENFSFKDCNNNIDYINQQAILSNDYDEQLSLLMLATEKVEKFHSFFHFEQSYFHLQLAIHLKKKNKLDEANAQLEAAIFQDHVNEQAIALFNNTQTSVNPYQRQYAKFIDYLYFATEENGDCISQDSYWNDYLEYQAEAKSEILEKIISKIRRHHLGYHQESAKLYLNRAAVFDRLGQKELAKNDLVKANNLDSDLRKRGYYKIDLF